MSCTCSAAFTLFCCADVKEKTTGGRSSRRRSNPDPGPSQDRPGPEPELDPGPSQDGLISRSDPDLEESRCGPNRDHLGPQSPTAEGSVHPQSARTPGTSPASPWPHQEPSKDHSSPKLQTDPESGHNHLSPKPEPGPAQLGEERGCPEPGSDPAPRAVETSDGSAAHTLFLVFTSAEVDPAGPQPCSPGLGGSPVSMVMECPKAAAVPVETEGGGSSPAEQSPTFSPLASPCPRLDEEDSLSPLFHQNASEGPPILVRSKKL